MIQLREKFCGAALDAVCGRPDGSARVTLEANAMTARPVRHGAVLMLVMLAAACGGSEVAAPTVDPNAPGVPTRVDAVAADVNLTSVGSSSQIAVTVKDARGTVVPTADVSWSSVDLTIADVSGNGTTAIVTARAPGQTLVRARVGVLVADFAVTVVGARGVTLSPSVSSVRAGDKLQLTPKLDADSGARVDIRYQSDNPTLASVSSTGEVLGITPGLATIRAFVVGDPRLNAVALVTVTAPRSVAIQPSSLTTWVNDRSVIRAVVDVDSGQSSGVTWTTDNAAVATISSTGELVAVGVGSTRIRARALADSRAIDSASVQVLPERKVVVSPTAASLGAGQTQTLTAAVSIEAGLTREVTWRSSAPSVAVVASNGLVTGVSQGAATITAISVADTTRRGTATIQIVPVARDIDLEPTAASIFMGDVKQLAVTLTVDSGGSREVQWRTSNASVVTVTAGGQILGIAPGTAIVSAISQQDTTVRATSLITVRNAVVVTISPTSLTINPSDVRTLTATVRADAGVSTAVTWRSVNAAIAAVDQSGQVAGLTAGTTTIEAISVSDTTRRGQATVNVVPAVRSGAITPSTSSMAPTESRAFTASVTGDAGVSNAVVWRTSDASIVSIAGTGMATAMRIGTATITALAAGDTTKRATATITVRAAPIVTVSPSVVSLVTGQQQTATAVVQADAGVSTAVTWSSANSSVATVSQSGVITAVGVGATTVTATSVADPTRQATVSVTVNPQILSVAVSPGTLALGIGSSGQFTATVSAQGGLSTAVVWRSSNPSVASVSSGGSVAALATGSAVITALSAVDTTKRATATVTVTVATPRLATSWSSTRIGGPLYEDVVSIDGLDASNAFAVNSVGDVYRYLNGTWALAAAGSSYGTQFLAVSAASTSQVIAVGTNGVIARFNGSSWSSMSSGVSTTLNSVYVESGTTAFAVGANGVALRYNGSTWSATSSGTTQTLYQVWSSGGIAFAVGSNGAALRYNGSAWSTLSSGTTETLYGVAGTSTTDVVAVGTYGTVLRYNGSAWSRVSTTVTADLYSVSGGSTMYIGSDNGVLQLSGSTVSTTGAPYAPRVFAISADNVAGVWASGQRGSVMRLSGSWTTLNLAPDLIDVWTTSSSNAWAVGEFGTVFRWSGSSWTRQTTSTTATLNAVWAASSTDAFAGGDRGTMLRWNGSSWSVMSFPSTASVYGLWGTSTSNVYAVTSAGEVVRFNGSSWGVVATASAGLWAVHGISATEILATGENGVGLRYNGSTWSSLNASTGGTLAGAFVLGTSNYLAVGSNTSGTAGQALLGTAGGWSATNTGSSRILTSVWGPSVSDLYATGEQGTLLRFNGSSWSTMTSGTTDLLWSVSGASDATGGFAVGYNSTIVTATPGSGLVAAARVALTTGTQSLNPRVGATVYRGPLPEGRNRRNRHH